MFETILVPLDGSEHAEAVLAPVLELRDKFASKLILVRVVEDASQRLVQAPPLIETPGAAVATVEMVEKTLQADREEATSYLTAVKQRLGGDVETVKAEGPVVETLIRLARERQASLIVMSSHGRSGILRLVFGSVADGVLHKSDVPVLLVRIRDGEGKK
jgi:nucleotide-binding universal stress UspA family protein